MATPRRCVTLSSVCSREGVAVARDARNLAILRQPGLAQSRERVAAATCRSPSSVRGPNCIQRLGSAGAVGFRCSRKPAAMAQTPYGCIRPRLVIVKNNRKTMRGAGCPRADFFLQPWGVASDAVFGCCVHTRAYGWPRRGPCAILADTLFYPNYVT